MRLAVVLQLPVSLGQRQSFAQKLSESIGRDGEWGRGLAPQMDFNTG